MYERGKTAFFYNDASAHRNGLYKAASIPYVCVHYRQHVHKQPLEEQKELLQAKGILTHLRGKEGKMDRGRTAQHTTTPTPHTNNKMRKEKKNSNPTECKAGRPKKQ